MCAAGCLCHTHGESGLHQGPLLAPPSAVGLAVDVVHVHLEVVVPRELLVAELALRQRAVRVVRHLVSDQHFLQAERQVAHLGETTRYQ